MKSLELSTSSVSIPEGSELDTPLREGAARNTNAQRATSSSRTPAQKFNAPRTQKSSEEPFWSENAEREGNDHSILNSNASARNRNMSSTAARRAEFKSRDGAVSDDEPFKHMEPS